MATITYYFNSKSSDWENDPENMIDGDIDTDSNSEVNEEIELLNGNECAGADLGDITKVEIRAHGWVSGGAGYLRLIPVFGGSDDGDNHSCDFYAEGWSSYIDITSDTNASDWDAWTDIQNLDCKAQNIINGGRPYVSKVEIRVTYTPSFTSKATGNWDSEGESTWNEPGHPIAGSSVTIQNGHTITLDSAAACTNLTIDSGGALTDATNNQGLTVSYRTLVSGTLTCGTAAMSFGSAVMIMTTVLEIKAGGTFVGGSGAHTIGALSCETATSTCTMTSGTCTFDGSDSGNNIIISSDSTFAHNDGTIILTYSADLDIDTQSLYNLTLNQAGITFLNKDLTIANDFTITAGTFNSKEDGGATHNLTIGGNLSNAGTFSAYDSLVTLNGTGQSLTGSWTFWSLTKSVAAADTLTFDNTGTYTFGGNVTLNGMAGELLSIVTESAGDAFNFTMNEAAVKTNLEYLSVKDSDASDSHADHKPIEPTDSTDVSGNTDWFSGGEASVKDMSQAILNTYYY